MEWCLSLGEGERSEEPGSVREQCEAAMETYSQGETAKIEVEDLA